MLSLNTVGVFALVLGCSLSWSQDLPWHLGSVDAGQSAPSAINTAGSRPGPNEIVVAVIDRGVIGGHPSLEGRLLPGYDMVARRSIFQPNLPTSYASEPQDPNCGERLRSSSVRSHGTAIVSLIAGNGSGGAWGVNTGAKVVPIRVQGACGVSRRDVLDSIAWAAGLPVQGVVDNPNPARVINLSLSGGSLSCGADMQELLQRVIAKNIFVVAAAGNTYHKPLLEPANCKGVISVGALDANNRVTNYSALDPRIVLYAPGGGADLQDNVKWSVNKLKVAVFEPDTSGKEVPIAGYRGIGTSYAASIVTGFVSLWLSYQPQKTVDDFFKEVGRFTREVEPVANCQACVPRGLTGALAFTGS